MAANPHKGEFEIEANGRTFKGKLGWHAFAIIEARVFKETGLKVGIIRFFQNIGADAQAQDFSARDLITILAGGFNQYHPELTDAAIGDIIDDAGIIEIRTSIEGAIAASLQRYQKGAAANGAGDPPIPAAQ